MFRNAVIQLRERLADAIDEMLVGDFDYSEDPTGLYGGLDYHRDHPHRLQLSVPVIRRAQCNAPALDALTVAGMRCQNRDAG